MNLLKVAQRMNAVEEGALKKLPLPDPRVIAYAGHLPPGFERTLKDELRKLIQSEYELVAQVSLAELASRAGGRAYAQASGLLGDAWSRVADFYDVYLTRLVGVASTELLQRVHDALKTGEALGEDMAGIVERLRRVLQGWRDGRLRTIVRTEGTRAASLARREMARLARDAGWGPDFYVGNAIMDDRVTRTCAHWHGWAWTPEQDEVWGGILHTPNHYNCRSMVTYAWKGEKVRLWDERRLEEWLRLQKEEFPDWDNNLVRI